MEDIEIRLRLIASHSSENNNQKYINKIKNRKWCINKSNLSGRGVFAKTNINVGDIIFVEKPLLIGLAARKNTDMNICTICYKLLGKNYEHHQQQKEVEIQEFRVCNQGCSLPVCEECCNSQQHMRECNIYKEWKPIQPNIINQNSLRFLTTARGLLLDKNEKDLLYKLQANNDPKYETEIIRASNCFEKFQNDSETLNFFNRVVSVLNTNAFEILYKNGSHEVTLRGLYALSGILNHDCVPNTTHEFDENNMIIMKACKFIPEGSEITTTYTKLLWNNLMRRTFLKVTKGFICMCSRCRDPTENGTYLSAVFCRDNSCFGCITPNDYLEKVWTCGKCKKDYSISDVIEIQNLSLNIINSKITSSCSEKEIIEFINNKIPRICPSSSHLALEAKITCIWRLGKSTNTNYYSEQIYNYGVHYCKEALEVLEKLEVGECLLKTLLLKELENFKQAIERVRCIENN